MGLAIETTLESRNPIASSTRTVVENVFESVRQTVKSRLMKYQQTPELYRYLTQKVSNLKLQIGLPSPMKAESYVKNYYVKLSVLKSNLFESYRNGLMFLKKMEERLLIVPHKDDWLVPHTLSIDGNCRYAASNNTVVVPRILLTPLVFEDKYPRYDQFYKKPVNLLANIIFSSIIYGRLGVAISRAVIESVLPFESAWTWNNKLLSSFHGTVNESVKSVEATSKCLSDFISSNQLSVENSGNWSTLSALKHLSAVSVAQEVGKTSLYNKNEVKHAYRR